MATSQDPRADQDDEDKMPPEFTPTSLVWLPQPKTGKQEATGQQGWIQGLKRSQDHEIHMWRLMEISLPPLLSRKYHMVNVAELMKDGDDGHFMGVATWFVMWCQAFGAQFLNTVEQKYLERNKLETERKSTKKEAVKVLVKQQQNEWRESVNEKLKLVRETDQMDSAPKLKDNCSSASEFLLEPCIIIQLPWNTVLLHQWLVAALVEVLIFEKGSLELKHWPLPPEIEPTARELACAVKKLKQRIVLGFILLSHQVAPLPDVDSRVPGWILDEVILPSLATLQFLLSGKASTMLKSIKKLAWSKTEAFGNRVYIHSMIYSMDIFLSNFFFRCGYNAIWWSTSVGSPFPKENVKEIKEVIQRLQNNQCKAEVNVFEFDGSRKIPSIEEQFVIGSVIKSQKSPILHKNKDERVELALKTIKELIYDTGRISKYLFEKIKIFYMSDQVKKIIAEEFTLHGDVFEIDLMILHSLMYWDLHTKLLDSEKENSVVARIVNLGLEILEREQIIRLANISCTFFKEKCTPVAANPSRLASMSIQSMTEVLSALDKKEKSYTRDWLWSQFPEEWRKPVSLKEPAMLEPGVIVLTQVAKVCEERIGRIVFNLARTSFGVFERGGEVFQHWQTVQYILPCFVAAFIEDTDNYFLPSQCDKLFNYINFLDGILKYYETSFHDWLKSIKPRQIVKQQQDIPREIVGEVLVLCKYYSELNYILQAGCVGAGSIRADGPVEGFYGFSHLYSSLVSWPIFISNCTSSLSVLENSKVWVEKAFYFLQNLYEISCKSWKIVMPGSSQITCKRVREIHFADAVLSYLYTLHTVCSAYKVPRHLPDPIEKLLQESRIEPLLPAMQFRYDLFKIATGKTEHIGKKEINHIFEEERKSMVKMYEALKSFREKNGKIEPKFTLGNIPSRPPELKVAVRYYIQGNFDALDKMLPILTENEKKPARSVPSKTQKSVKVEKPKSLESVPSKSVVFQKCRNCPKTERKWGPFKACEKCVKEKYPDINFFCSKECQEKWWKEEHMAEHLEFELGLSHFSNLNLNSK